MIGKRLCQSLSGLGEVYAIVRESKKSVLSGYNVKVICSDMSEYKNITEKIKEHIDVAILLAWEGTRGEERNCLSVQEKNFSFNMDLIGELEKLHIKKIILAGSQAEYGIWPKDIMVNEEMIANPMTEYGKYKLKFYLEAKKICEAIKVVLIEPRIFSLYGPDDYENSLVMSMLRKMKLGEVCDLTECKHLWNFLYIDDAIDALVGFVVNDCEAGIYNLASEDTRELRDFVEEMYIVSQSRSLLNYGIIKYPATGVINLNPNIEKIRNTGWKEKTEFKQGIKKILNSMC